MNHRLLICLAATLASALSAAGETTNRNAETEWKVVYTQAFDTAASLKDFAPDHGWGVVRWDPTNKCLRVEAPERGGGDDLYLVLLKSFPGDIRVTVRARNVPPESHFFGMLISAAGMVRTEAGYFVEWNRGWLRQLKKYDEQQKIVQVTAPAAYREAVWKTFTVERVDGTIRMITDGKEDLSWSDPYPLRGGEYGTLAFYVWKMKMEFDDLVIEQKAAVPISGSTSE